MERTFKLPRDNMDVELIQNINNVIGEYIKTHPPKNLSDVARVIQSAQSTYQGIKKKTRKKSEWFNNIEKKIESYNQELSSLIKYKDLTELKKPEIIKKARKIMKKYDKLLIRKGDLEIVESEINNRISIYKKKLECYEKRLEFRYTNRKFELYRGKFYRDIETVQSSINSNIKTDEVVKFWNNMWNEDLLDNSDK